MNALTTRARTPMGLLNVGTKEFVSLHIGDHLFGACVTDIRDVFVVKGLTQVPGARPEVAGVLNLRGHIVTAIDARRRLGMPARPQGYVDTMAVGVEHKGEVFGILVDRVGEVLRMEDDDFEPNPVNLDPAWRDVSFGVYRLEGNLMITLNLDSFLAVDPILV